MLSLLIGGAESLHGAVAKQLGAVEVALGVVVGRRDEVDESLFKVGSYGRYVVEVAFGYGHYLISVAAYAIEMTPTVTLAFPCEPVVVVEPQYVVVGV